MQQRSRMRMKQEQLQPQQQQQKRPVDTGAEPIVSGGGARRSCESDPATARAASAKLIPRAGRCGEESEGRMREDSKHTTHNNK